MDASPDEISAFNPLWMQNTIDGPVKSDRDGGGAR